MRYRYICPKCNKFFFSQECMDWVTCISCGKDWTVKETGKGSRIREATGCAGLQDTASFLVMLFGRIFSPGLIVLLGIYFRLPFLHIIAAFVFLVWLLVLSWPDNG